jgi:hypothetical protein
MASESPFLSTALKAAKSGLRGSLTVEKHAPLLYELKVSDSLEIMDPERVKHPARGTSAFQTDLCVFETLKSGARLPRVVVEFKTRVTTHDILTYSAKATRHKRIYPYLRYGLIASMESIVPGRAFTHNEALDFVFASSGLSKAGFADQFLALLNAEVAASRLLQRISYSKLKTRLFRVQPIAARRGP